MPTKKTNEAKIKIWTDRMTSEMNGTISAVVIETFGYIMPGKDKTAAEMRELALKLMQERHERMKEAGL